MSSIIYIIYKCVEKKTRNTQNKTTSGYLKRRMWNKSLRDVQKFQRSTYFEMVPPGGQVIHTDHSFWSRPNFLFFFFQIKNRQKRKEKKRNFWHFNFRRKKKCYRSCHHINSMTLSDCSSQDAKRKKKLLEKKIRILQINQINFASTEFLIQWPVRRCESRMESSPRKRKKKKKKNAIV